MAIFRELIYAIDHLWWLAHIIQIGLRTNPSQHSSSRAIKAMEIELSVLLTDDQRHTDHFARRRTNDKLS